MQQSDLPARCGEDGAAGGLGGPEPAAPVPFDEEADCVGSYYEAVAEIRHRDKAARQIAVTWFDCHDGVWVNVGSDLVRRNSFVRLIEPEHC